MYDNFPMPTSHLEELLDIATLKGKVQKATDVQNVENIATRVAVQELSNAFAASLEPFIAVQTASERWRDETQTMAKDVLKAAKALGMDTSKLESGIEGLEQYNDMHSSRSVHTQIVEESLSEPERIMNILEIALKRLLSSVEGSIDEWQLKKDAREVNDLSSSLRFKACDFGKNRELYTRTIDLYNNVAQAMDLAAKKSALHEKILRNFAKNGRERSKEMQESLTEATARV